MVNNMVSIAEALQWKNPMESLRKILKDEEQFVNAANLHYFNTDQVRDNVAELYVRYMVTSNQLSECYKYTIQPQIRILIQKTLMCMYGRIYEFKQILIGKDSSIFTPIITELSNLKILYEHFELKIPEYFRDERQLFLNDIDEEIGKINVLYNVKNNAEPNQLQEEISITEEQRSNDGQSIRQEVTESDSVNVGKDVTFKKPDFNVTELMDEFRERQNKADIMLRTTINMHEERFTQIYKHIIMDKILDLLQAYIWVYYKRSISFPSWPEDPKPMFTNNDTSTLISSNAVLKNISEIYDKLESHKIIPLGGSNIFRVDSWTTQTAEIIAPLIVGFQYQPTQTVDEPTKESKQNNKKEKTSTDDTEVDVELISDITEWFKEVFDEFDSFWTVDDILKAEPREDLIEANLFAKNKIELRVMAYTTTQEHLIKLKIAHGRDIGVKYKVPKTKKSKKKKQGTKGRKKKRPQTSEEILEELVRNKMIKISTTTKFDEFLGEVSYSANELRGNPYYYDPPYGLGDTRQIIKEQYAIGLIFPQLRTLKRIRFNSSLLIAGPEKSGKTMLINALCTETSSLKIELNLKNLSENYPGIKEVNGLVSKIITFAQAYQPVVIEVDLADVPFYKKIPDNLKQFKPKLMVRLLSRLLKQLKNTERVIVIGKAISPWLAVGKKLTKVFQTVLFTVPDYNTIQFFITNLLVSYSVVREEIPITELTTLMFGYPRQTIADIVAKVMTAERVSTLGNNPLDHNEFIPVMKDYPKESNLSDKYHNWYRKCVPMGIRKKLKMEEKINGKEEINKNPKTKK